MRWVDRTLGRVLGRRRIYDDLSAEIRAHLDEKADALVAQGMSRHEAYAAAGRSARVAERNVDAAMMRRL